MYLNYCTPELNSNDINNQVFMLFKVVVSIYTPISNAPIVKLK